MAQTQTISKILYGICLVLSVAYLLTAVYSVFCLVTGFGVTPYGEDRFLHINYPFSERSGNPAAARRSYLRIRRALPAKPLSSCSSERRAISRAASCCRACSATPINPNNSRPTWA